MAGYVMRSLRLSCVAAAVLSTVLLSAGPSSWAAGPAAPFVAPMLTPSADADGVQAGAGENGLNNPSGLSGVRLGRQVGAVIDGQWVRKGGQVRGARLVGVQRARVVLKHPDGHQEIIEMYPPQGVQAGASAPASTEAVKP